MRLVDEEEMKEEREIKDGIPFVILFPFSAAHMQMSTHERPGPDI